MSHIQYHFKQTSENAVKMVSSNTQYKMVNTDNLSPGFSKPTLLTLLEMPKIFEGYLLGRRQRVCRVVLQVSFFHASMMGNLQNGLKRHFASHSFVDKPIDTELDLTACLGEAVCAIQKEAGLPIFEAIQMETELDKPHAYSLWLPVVHEECFHPAMAFMLQFVAQHLASVQAHHFSDEMNELISVLHRFAPRGTNSLRLLEAAHLAGMPWFYLAQNVYQYGYGIHSRWFDSSFTDLTSKIAAELVKDKRSAHQVLKMAGLPVPAQAIVNSEAEALEQATKLGYPVVVKPSHQDGGAGVSAGLMMASDVKNAFHYAKQYGHSVLIEKHITGRDYRLLTLNGKIIWAIERVPAGVTGDGIHTIAQLIDRENQRPERNAQVNARLKPINVNEAMLNYLASRGLDVDTIPANNQFVALSRIANISAGGTPVAVFDKIHPDNCRLIEAVVQLLRLDIAGVDFITDDIEQSYAVNGGSLIEVNAQPQFGIITSSHVYQQVLTTLLPRQGRIPIFVIVGNVIDETLIEKINRELAVTCQRIGKVGGGKAYLNDEMIYHADSSFNACRSLLMNSQVDGLIYVLNDWKEMDEGLPFDRYDRLYFVDMPEKLSEFAIGRTMIQTLLSACEGERVLSEAVRNDLIAWRIVENAVL